MKQFLNKNPRGFISIIAIGIFALLSIFGIMIQMTVIDTVQGVKNTNNYYQARDIADSISEFLLFELNTHESGYNLDMECETEEGTGELVGSAKCQDFVNLIAGKNIEMEVKIKGRSTDGSEGGEDQRLNGSCPGGFSPDQGCYVVPFPGTGDSGERCILYDPKFINDSGDDKVDPVVTGPIVGYQLEQEEFSCNWNKLSFGSSSTDRVSIPLFYEDATGAIKNPFNTEDGESGTGATRIVLRIRPPCLPCVFSPETPVSGVTRTCERGQDPTVCNPAVPTERYALNASLDDAVVVQWQLSGVCPVVGNDEECGLIPFVPEDLSVISAITGSLIAGPNDPITGGSKGIDTSTYSSTPIPFTGFLQDIPMPILFKLKKGILTIFLSEALISNRDKNIPYLEYQLLTDKPVGDSRTRMEVSVNIEGNIFTKTLYKGEQKGLIDFAIQN